MPTAPTGGSSRAGSDTGTSGLILVAVIALTVFNYWTRADVLGVCGPGREWTAMTGNPVTFVRHNLAAGILLGLVPLLLGRFWCGLGLRDLGLGKGRTRRGLAWLAVGVPLALLAGKLSAGQAVTRAVYPLDPGVTPAVGDFARHAAFHLLYFCGWEILFRGVLLRALAPRFGFATANVIQTALSVTAHFGRPFSETFAAIPAGLAFGGVARHTGTVWYVILIHWAVGMAQDWFILTGGPF